MSATALAHRLAPQATHGFVAFVQKNHTLATGPRESMRAVYREHLGEIGAALVKVIRGGGHRMSDEELEDEMARSSLNEPGGNVGLLLDGDEVLKQQSVVAAAAYMIQSTEFRSLRAGEQTEHIEIALQKILRAALTTDRVLSAKAVLVLLDKRGRPKTPPEVISYVGELRKQHLPYKEIARRLNAAVLTDEWARGLRIEPDFTSESVRALLNPRASKAKKKR